jgi:hypothetical protein
MGLHEQNRALVVGRKVVFIRKMTFWDISPGITRPWHIRVHVLICFLACATYPQFARIKRTMIECNLKAAPAGLPVAPGCHACFQGRRYVVRI